MKGALPLTQHDVLDRGQSAEVLERVLSLRAHWTHRAGGSFFTLGAASYLDATPDRSAYDSRALVANSTLAGFFAGLLARIRFFFETFLDDAVSFDPKLALPGFHVYMFDGSDRSCDDVSQRAHFDLQWMHLFAGVKPESTLSFTLPIEIPTGGATMELWHVTYDHLVRLKTSARSHAARHPSQALPYVIGRIVVHDGLLLHAVGRAEAPAPRGLRVTLQGHGLRRRDGWTLYW
jgi:hypothetical protein